MNLSFIGTSLALAAGIFAGSLSANSLPNPTGPVVLSVTGAIERINGEAAASFDMALLHSLEQSEITTDTIWTPGTHQFSGVLLKTLLKEVGASGSRVTAFAINDYSVVIPISDATDAGPIVAFAMDGQPMSRREKGPLWIIYPYSSGSEYRTEVIYARSIWQLNRLHIEE